MKNKLYVYVPLKYTIRNLWFRSPIRCFKENKEKTRNFQAFINPFLKMPLDQVPSRNPGKGPGKETALLDEYPYSRLLCEEEDLEGSRSGLCTNGWFWFRATSEGASWMVSQTWVSAPLCVPSLFSIHCPYLCTDRHAYISLISFLCSASNF